LPEADIDKVHIIDKSEYQKQLSLMREQHQKVAAMERLQELLKAGKSIVI